MHRGFENNDDEFVLKDSQGNIEDGYYDDDFEPNQNDLEEIGDSDGFMNHHIGSKGLK